MTAGMSSGADHQGRGRGVGGWLQALPTGAYVAMAAVVAVALVGFGMSGVGAGEEEIEIHKMASASFEGFPDGAVFIGIIGTDERPGIAGARADAIQLVGVNPEQRKASIVSIPRDTFVEVPGHGRRKILDTHNIGGAELVGRTLTEFTGAPVHYVVTTNFAGFVGLVDEVGGVRAEVPMTIRDPESAANFPAGRHLLSGDAALALARARKTLPRGDFDRTWHQGLLLRSGHEQLLGDDPGPTDTMRLVATLMRHLKTTSGVTIVDLYQLGRLALTIDPDDVTHVIMPGTTGSVGGASVVLPTERAPALFADVADDGVLSDPSLGDTGRRLDD